MKEILIGLYIFLFALQITAEASENQILSAISKYEFEIAEELLHGDNVLYNEKERTIWLYFITSQKKLSVEGVSPPEIKALSGVLKIISILNQGLFQFYELGNELGAFQNFNKALKESEQLKNDALVTLCIIQILEIYDNYDQPLEDISYKFFLERFKKVASNDIRRALLSFYKFRLELRFNLFNTDTRSLYDEANRNVKKLDNLILNMDLNTTNASYHYHVKKNIDSANYYLDKVIENISPYANGFSKRLYLAALINKSRYLILNNKPEQAKKLIQSVRIEGSGYLWDLARAYFYDRKKMIFEQLNERDSSQFYNLKGLEIQLEIDQNKSLAAIAELETKYQTAEKDKQLLVEQQRATKNRNWLIAASLALLLGTGIAILLQKNTTKKRLLAEQEAVLKQQRVENLLKEQELVSIDAMIAGQEKERQKVAGELHDDLGSLMATIKLHFDNAKVAKQDPALKNAQKLLEEAYQKIRGMAHNKNSGVMSNQGLLPAIKKMAKTITETNAMVVTVEDFGLGERLENSLELSIFRMVQELVANAIKHAEASKVNIQLTQHEDNLNIIVEDNGKGFERSKLDRSKSGMGLTNIEKRVEHLEGSFTVDSVLGKGTSILIDIPV